MPSENNPKWCFFWKYRKGVVNLHLLKLTACLKIMCVFPLHSSSFFLIFCLTVFSFVTCRAMKWETRHEVWVICKGCTSLSPMHQQTSCTSYIWWSFLQSEFLGFKYCIRLQIWVSTKTTWLWGHKKHKKHCLLRMGALFCLTDSCVPLHKRNSSFLFLWRSDELGWYYFGCYFCFTYVFCLLLLVSICTGVNNGLGTLPC